MGKKRPVEDNVLRVSEVFSSIQGEGVSAGLPSVFLRLALCNLRCRWCDTKYTWDWKTYRYEAEVEDLDVSTVAQRLTTLLEALERKAACDARLIITGGEPLLQQPGLTLLFERLPPAVTIEIETNGTIAPADALRRRVSQWNVSPKLSNSGDPVHLRVRQKILQEFRDTDRAWLKLVVATAEDLAEADQLVDSVEWPRERAMLMAEASDRQTLSARMPWVIGAARVRGWRVSPRLHIERFDGARGV